MAKSLLQRTRLSGLLIAGAVAIGVAVPAIASSGLGAGQTGSRQSGGGQASRLTLNVRSAMADQSVVLLPDPGPGGALSFSIGNRGDLPLSVSAVILTPGAQIGSDRGGCGAYATFSGPDMSSRPWPPIAPHGTLQVNGADNNQLGLGLIHLAKDTPSACQGANLTIPVTVTASLPGTAWTATATGNASAQASRMPAGRRPVATIGPDTTSITVSWTASTFPDGSEVARYLVARSVGAGAPVQVCDAAAPVLQCTDALAAGMTATYTVTPALVGAWRGATSSPSSPVSVLAAPVLTPAPIPSPSSTPTPMPSPASGARTAPAPTPASGARTSS